MMKRIWMGRRMEVEVTDEPVRTKMVRIEHGNGGYGYVEEDALPPKEERKGFLAVTVVEDDFYYEDSQGDSQDELAQAEDSQDELAQAEDSQDELAQAEDSQDELAQAEDSQDELAQDDSQGEDSQDELSGFDEYVVNYAHTLAALTDEYQDILTNHPPMGRVQRKSAMAEGRDDSRLEQLTTIRAQMRKLQDEFNRARARREVGRPMPWE